MKVSASGYYEWLGRPESPRQTRNRELEKLITQIHAESRGTYGWPRVHAELVLGMGENVNRKRVARLIRQAGLQGIHRRRGRKNLVSAATEEDLVHRQFSVDGLDRLWLTDITEHATAEGKVYCAAVMDACSRRVTGWSIDRSQKTELVVDAIGMAILRRRPGVESTILHSDHGTQGGFNRPSQHLDSEVSVWVQECGSGLFARTGVRFRRRVGRRWRGGRTGSGSGRGSRGV